VYVVEQPSGVRTITGVATSIALFIGMAQKGQLRRPTPVRSADQYDQIFGDSPTYGEMAVQVRQFFLNGGSEAIIVRATGIGPGAAEQAAITLTSEAGDESNGAEPVLRLQAKDAGALSNEIRAIVDYDTATPELTFNLEVFRRSVDENGATVISENEFFGDLSMAPNHPRFVNTVLATQSALVQVDTDTGPTPTPGAGDRGFSQSALVLTGTGQIGANAGDDTTAITELDSLLSGGSSIRIALGNGAPVTVTLPTGILNFGTWRDTAVGAINGALMAASQPGSVEIDTVAFGPGRCLRITASAAESGQSVVVTPAASNDGTGALQLGNTAGGIEIGTYSRFRPAPSGYVTRINEAVDNSLAQNTNLDRLINFAGADPDDLTGWSFDEGIGAAELTGSPMFAGATNSFLEGTANSDGIGSLRNTRLHLDSLAASLGSGLGTGWSVARYGYRIAIRPNSGDSNFGVDAALTGTGTFDFGGNDDIAAAAQAANTAEFTLGQSGTERRQTSGALGTDGGVPSLTSYQDIFTTVEKEVDLFNLMILPRGLAQSDADRFELWGPASTFCRQERALLIVDPPSDVGTGWHTVDDVDNGIADLRLGAVTDHAAIYWPRIRVAATTTPIDGSGSLGGIYGRIDTRRGVWKAAAGLEASILGATGFEHMVSDAENGVTNQEAVNTLRQFAAGGVVWGARTMAGFDNSGENDYKYVPVRRTALFIEESLFRGLKFAVFEPNDEPLWAQIRLAAGAFMQNLFRQGAFQGSKASDAYLVRCDETTTTQNDINLGRVNVLVGFAPLRPAEFVVLTVRQLAGQVQT
jgi:phage tail sheath protein FI